MLLAEHLNYTARGQAIPKYRADGEYDPYKRTEAAIDIENAIAVDGPIPYSQFMDLSLAGPHGYYSTGVVRISEEKSFDFTTYPEFNNSFGPTLGLAAARVWEELGCPEDFPLVEMGAGRGTLALRMLDWIAVHNPEFYAHISYKIVDFPGMAAKQRKTLESHGGKVMWYEGSALELPDEVKGIEGMFLSNELPDAFPVEVVKTENGQVLQKYIGAEHGKFVEIWKPASQDVRNHISEFDVAVPDKEITVNLNAVRFQHQVSSSLRRGLILTIDYGEDCKHYDGYIGSMRTFSENGKVLPASLAYEKPREVDMTANIDFYPLMQTARAYGGKVVLFDQPNFFLASGIEDVLPSMQNPEHENDVTRNGYAFKVLTIRHDLDSFKFNGGLRQTFNLNLSPANDIGMFRFSNSSPEESDDVFLESIRDSSLVQVQQLGKGEWEFIQFPSGPNEYHAFIEDLAGRTIVQYKPFKVLYDFRKKEDVERLLSDSGISGIDIDALLEGKPFI